MELKEIDAHITTLQQAVAKKKIISSRYACIRLLVLIFAIICIYYGNTKTSYFYYLLIFDIILFLWFVNAHRKIKVDIHLQETLVDCYEDIKKRKSDAWKQFEDNGSDFLDNENTQAYDLDIFGTASLFQYINCAKTVQGREELAKLLTCYKQATSEIQQRQGAVQELVNKDNFTIHMMALLKQFQQHARKKKKQTLETFFTYMEQNPRYYPPLVRCVFTCLPICTILSVCYAIGFQGQILYLGIFGLCSMSIALLSVIKNAQAFHDVNVLEHTLSDYEKMFKRISDTTFESILLQEQADELHDAYKALRKLNVIVNFIRLRNDGITFLLFNFFFLLDFQCVFALESWKKTYGKQIRKWYASLALFEAMISCAQIQYAKEQTCTPTMQDETKPFMEAKQLRHPLLVECVGIGNDVSVQGQTYIITGSNMSGKTTYLRTIGLNFVLFHAGANVCGTSFCATSMNIFTSMRIRDDVSEGISTFYAEILRIKDMIERSKQHIPMMVFIDEIFKGTNSADRIVCAKEVLKQLHVPHVISLVSTHDFELCELNFDEHKNAINYHFAEYYENDAIRFDYKLKEGKCKTTNAKELLRLAGVSIDTIV